MEHINLRARAKINLTLDVTGIRSDGYHELKMIMQTVELYDRVFIKKTDKPGIKIKSNLEWLPCDSRNLAYKAANLMMSRYGIDDGVFIELRKSIPVAAGLAGGSADCAAVLYGMNILFGLGVSRSEMSKAALELGSDVPYCLMRGTALAEGRGEILTKLPPCPNAWVVLAKPTMSLSTAAVYKAIDAVEIGEHPDCDGMIEDIKNSDIYGVSKKLSNVLEAASIPMCPMIADIKKDMLDLGALNSLMSGSGPTVYGLFDNKETAKGAADKIKKKYRLRDVVLTKIFNV
ncbi:MAG: 4-(cytidine 5'-diphospho)-2-C-methyl-D-erythritol kinase [Clostridia bacterium]|nr:4-(cytidine 5'-diphospho)-2-C-methyl-D-erythritol kinase [Clostridia bacterium]